MSNWDTESKETARKLENFILEKKWEDFPQEVRERAVVCAIDLFGTMIACSQTRMAQNGIALAKKVFPCGEIPVIGTKDKLNTMGAVTAYGYNINALDIDDGHNMIKGHPGAVLMAGILPVAIEVEASYQELLTALVIGYEVAIRAGLALHKYYGFYHGTGSWGAFGVAAAVARLRKVDRAVLANALGIADYQGPVAPVMRIVEIPSMNKDGIAWGAITGVMAVEAAQCGITGEFYNLLEPENQILVNTLGETYEILNLYFKYFPCCRWAHAPIIAALELNKEHKWKPGEIESIKIYTFKAATQLSSKIPVFCDEAQYNMVYPVCAAIVEGKFTPVQDSEEYIKKHPEILALMEKVEYSVKKEFEDQFPKKRFAQVEIVTKDGKHYFSNIVEPWGEKEEKVGIPWITEKLRNTVNHCFPLNAQEKLLGQLKDVKNKVVWKDLIEKINDDLGGESLGDKCESTHKK